jgi:hypothetical protein
MDDPTFNTLLIIAANALVVYFLLKRQEQRLSKKLFEDQVKFQRLHEKRVEALETLHKKFRQFADSIDEMIKQGTKIKSWYKPLTLEDLAEINLKVTEDLKEVRRYFSEVKLFIPDKAQNTLSDIFNRAEYIHDSVRLALYTEDWGVPKTMWVKEVQQFTGAAPEMMHSVSKILYSLSEYLNLETAMIEALYKSIADTEEV